MDQPARACAECAKHCQLLHGKKKNSSDVVTSFFKVMIGDKFSEVLYLPPKFGPTVSALVDQKTILEDSQGQRWEVTITIVDESFAFQKGWNDFSLSHDLEVGDFLVFNYIMGSHFVVRIYNRTACEKVEFLKNRNKKKRTRNDRNSTTKDGLHRQSTESIINRQGSSASVVSTSDVQINPPQCEVDDVEDVQRNTISASNFGNGNRSTEPLSKVVFWEDPLMIHRDLGDKQTEERGPTFDVLNYEIWNNSAGDGNNKHTIGDAGFPVLETFLTSQYEASLYTTDQVSEGTVRKVPFPDASESQVIAKNKCPEEKDKLASACCKSNCGDKTSKHLALTSIMPLIETGEYYSLLSNREVWKCQTPKGSVQLEENEENVSTRLAQKSQFAKGSDNSQSRELLETTKKELVDMMRPDMCSSEEIGKEIFGGMLKTIKKELVEIGQETLGSSKVNRVECGQSAHLFSNDDGAVFEVEKAETVGYCGIHKLNTANISCVVAADNPNFLELPTCLPSSSVGGEKLRRVVLLQDPSSRLWSVLYHEHTAFKILGSGWKAFLEANYVLPGDECVFRIENELEDIYAVHIVRRQHNSSTHSPKIT
ncbi:B3 domain-containing protein [Quillaja saponaria]|uniref:B3 domain-containing protein n=1 Tax=Quillaja saponaria TaxID=32244 RepID=A0AAD7LDG1_QUISA|nr:B3 domain-containing protein [Quillaja saponaria]